MEAGPSLTVTFQKPDDGDLIRGVLVWIIRMPLTPYSWLSTVVSIPRSSVLSEPLPSAAMSKAMLAMLARSLGFAIGAVRRGGEIRIPGPVS